MVVGCTRPIFGHSFVSSAVVLMATMLLGGCSGGNETSDRAAPSPEVGQVAQALGTAPEFGCAGVSYQGHDYWFCPQLRTWTDARTKCEARGYNLVRIEDATENEFVRARSGLGAWIGANDIATEGAWVWTFGGSKFWTGSAGGAPFGGLYSKWALLQPDNLLNQDCGRIATDGTWTDETCVAANAYVCESGTDQCPADPQKVVPGACGCGVSDIDTDSDGTPDCRDQCPSDPKKVYPGDCGCANAPAAAGSACHDGLCSANKNCDGAGVCGNPALCTPPDLGCTYQILQNNYYWICNTDRVFGDARQRCQTAGMDLSSVESAAEDSFLTSKTSLFDHILLGATDSATEGTWVWTATGQQFWSGGPTGAPTASAYTNFSAGEPSDGLLGQDCLTKNPQINGGQWSTRACGLPEGYVCEQVDLCPTDPAKRAPGQCGCGHSDADSDLDGIPDCIDPCPTCGTDHFCTSGGVCTACDSGRLDCDRSGSNACEIAIGTDTSCGTSCADMTVCQQGQTCHEGVCEIPTPPNVPGSGPPPTSELPPPLSALPNPPGPVTIVPLTVAGVDAFIESAAASRASQDATVAAAIAAARGQPGLVDALAARVPIGQPSNGMLSQWLVTISILGELRDPAAYGPLKALITQPLPAVVAAHGTMGPRDAIEMVMLRAVQALANLQTRESDAAVLEFSRSHRARAVRIAAGAAYLFVKHDTNAAKQILAAYVSSVESPDIKMMFAPRKTRNMDPAAFNAAMQTFFAEFPEENPPAPPLAP